MMVGSQTHFRRLLLGALVAAFYCLICWWPQVMDFFGTGHLGVWFLDTRALLAASDAHQLGLDPSERNPLDLFNQPHVYSNWWFALGKLGLTRADTLWLGGLLGFGFLIVATLQASVRSIGEVLWSTAIILAPGVMLGFNRANADLLLFILLAAVVPCVISPKRSWHLLALAAIALATNLKYYPVFAGIVLLALPGHRKERWTILGIFVVLVLVSAIEQADAVLRYLHEQQRPQGLHTFGAGFGAHLLRLPAWFDSAGALIAGLVVALVAWRRMPVCTVSPGQRGDYLRFILGATVLAASYFATVNYAYRLVFAIFLAPWLWSAWVATDWPAAFVRIGRVSSILLIVTLWYDGMLCFVINVSEAFSPQQAAALINGSTQIEKPVVLVFVLTLIAFITGFVRDEESRLRPPNPGDSELAD